jgi:2-dehydro-3-deoxyphosphogluconate aldolase / (4S)-4-hydroxy-2-oxoglutarate aldolase
MLSKQEVFKRVTDCGIVAVFRAQDPTHLLEAAQAIAAGGLKVIEITLTMPNALAWVEKAVAKLPADITVGAGTVLDAETARLAILSGAHFVVSPGLDVKMIEMCHRYGVSAVPGTFSPTEIMQAQQAGADMIKIFPAFPLGPKFVTEVSGPFPGIPFVAASIGSLDNIPDYIAAGTAACCVLGNGVGGDAYNRRKFDQMTQAAQKIAAAVQQGRLQK